MSYHVRTWGSFSMYQLTNSIYNKDFSRQITDSKIEVPGYFVKRVDDLINTDFNKIDVATISYGTNDCFAYYPPDLSNPNNLFDPKTFEGSIRYSISLLRSSYPSLKIILTTPIYRGWYKNGGEFKNDINDPLTNNPKGHNLIDYRNSIIKIANEMNIIYYDAFYELGFNKDNASTYYDTQLDDGTHLNALGRKTFASKLGTFIKNII